VSNHIDHLTLHKAERTLAGYITVALADSTIESLDSVIAEICQQLLFLKNRTAKDMPSATSDSLLRIAAACVVYHAQILAGER
jgi:hypothetical protein